METEIVARSNVLIPFTCTDSGLLSAREVSSPSGDSRTSSTRIFMVVPKDDVNEEHGRPNSVRSTNALSDGVSRGEDPKRSQWADVPGEANRGQSIPHNSTRSRR